MAYFFLFISNYNFLHSIHHLFIYTSNSTLEQKKASYCQRLFACFSTVGGWISNPYETYVDLMYHLFDSSFGMLMVYFTFFFYAQCLICALLIYLVGMIEPDCVVFDGNTLSDITQWFDACWTLSWTTYSTTVSDIDIYILYIYMYI
jgi:hypothetical protein